MGRLLHQTPGALSLTPVSPSPANPSCPQPRSFGPDLAPVPGLSVFHSHLGRRLCEAEPMERSAVLQPQGRSAPTRPRGRRPGRRAPLRPLERTEFGPCLGSRHRAPGGAFPFFPSQVTPFKFCFYTSWCVCDFMCNASNSSFRKSVMFLVSQKWLVVERCSLS